MRRTLLTVLTALLLTPPAGAQGAAFTSVPDAVVHAPLTAVTPTPTRATYPAGLLPLDGLGLEVRGDAPELAWAARDLRQEWQTRLGLTCRT